MYGIIFDRVLCGKITKKMSTAKKLYRSNDKKICGVCGGIAEYFDADPTLIRLLWVALTLFSACFPGIILYIIFAIVMPVRPFDSPDVRPSDGNDVVG